MINNYCLKHPRSLNIYCSEKVVPQRKFWKNDPSQVCKEGPCPDDFLIAIVSTQMTLTADELFVHKICVTYDIEMILGRFGPWEVPHAAEDQICQVSFQYHKLHRFYGKSAHQLLKGKCRQDACFDKNEDYSHLFYFLTKICISRPFLRENRSILQNFCRQLLLRSIFDLTETS